MAEETPQEREALEQLDAATREVAWTETGKEVGRERASWGGGPLVPWRIWRWFPRRRGPDPDPPDERGLRDALHGNDSAK